METDESGSRNFGNWHASQVAVRSVATIILRLRHGDCALPRLNVTYENVAGYYKVRPFPCHFASEERGTMECAFAERANRDLRVLLKWVNDRRPPFQRGNVAELLHRSALDNTPVRTHYQMLCVLSIFDCRCLCFFDFRRQFLDLGCDPLLLVECWQWNGVC